MITLDHRGRGHSEPKWGGSGGLNSFLTIQILQKLHKYEKSKNLAKKIDLKK